MWSHVCDWCVGGIERARAREGGQRRCVCVVRAAEAAVVVVVVVVAAVAAVAAC